LVGLEVIRVGDFGLLSLSWWLRRFYRYHWWFRGQNWRHFVLRWRWFSCLLFRSLKKIAVFRGLTNKSWRHLRNYSFFWIRLKYGTGVALGQLATDFDYWCVDPAIAVVWNLWRLVTFFLINLFEVRIIFKFSHFLQHARAAKNRLG